jgi:uncharacterized protein
MSMVVLAIAAVLAAVAPTPPPPTRWVEDHAGLVSPSTRATLDARLESYERATGHQVVVWIGRTLDGAPLDEWAVRTFAAWQVGRRGADDGLAMFVLAEDRAIAIEVGYGLEHLVPDAIASRIIHEVMTPRLRTGDADGALTAGVDAVLAAIEGRPWAATGETTPPAGDPSPITWVIGGLAGIGLLLLSIKHPRLAFWILWALMASGRGGRGFGGGGGLGGGGFAGGGGRSGGGGARGRW